MYIENRSNQIRTNQGIPVGFFSLFHRQYVQSAMCQSIAENRVNSAKIAADLPCAVGFWFWGLRDWKPQKPGYLFTSS